MSQEIREYINRLREAVNKRHKDGLDALSRLQDSLLGESETSSEGLALTPSMTVIDTSGSNSKPPVASGGSNVDLVLSTIRETAMTVEQIEDVTGLEASKVRGVLYSKSHDTRLTKRKHGKKMTFRLKSPGAEQGESVSSVILKMLGADGGFFGMTASEIAVRLSPKTTNQNTISSALFKLKKSGRITQDADGRYSISPAKR